MSTSEAAPGAAVLLALLELRDGRLAHAKTFAADYQLIAIEAAEAQKKAAMLRRDNAALSSEKQALLMRLQMGDLKSGVELEQQQRKLEAELTELYRKNTENVDRLMSVQRKLVEKEQESGEWKAAAEESRTQLEALRALLAEREMSLDTMRGEVHAVQARLAEKEKKVVELEKENTMLIERWIAYKNQEADRINALNEETRLQQQKAEALRKKGEEIMDDKVLVGQLDKKDRPMTLYSEVCIPSKATRDFAAHNGEANCVAFSASGTRLCTGGSDNLVKVFDSHSGRVLHALSGASGPIMCANWSADEAFILGCACDNSVRLWDVKVGRLRHTMTGHVGKVFGGVFTSDSARAVTGSHDRTLRLWDLSSGYSTKTIFCSSSCNDVCVSDAYQVIASAHVDGNVRMWDLRTGDTTTRDSTLNVMNAHEKQITSISYSLTAEQLLTLGRDDTLKIWDLRKINSNNALMTMKDDNYHCGTNWSRACWSPDAAYIAAGGADGSLFVWKTSDGSLVKQVANNLNQNNAIISCVAWSPVGNLVAATDRKTWLTFYQ